jgi:two-component system CheB/CheR fusion protein
MRALLDDLLDVSRLRFGRLALKKRDVSLRSVIASALETSRAQADKRRHTITVRLPDEDIVLHADPARMSQVLSNLVINAAKYTDEGGHIEVRAGVRDGLVRIEVADDGKGLDEAARRSMFEMFWRASEIDAGSAQGMGIGLAVARSVVQMHEGTIAAESDGPGKGSTIVITLPLRQAASPAAPADASVMQGPAQPHVARRRRVVVDGTSLLGLAQRERPEVAIVDLGMPGLSGYEVAERLRAAPHGRGMLLVAVTGWGSDGDRERSMKAGFDAHLVKPVSAETLCALIDDWQPQQP